MSFSSYSEYRSFIEKNYPRRESEAVYAHRIACGWRVECRKAGKSPTLAKKAMSPSEREAGAADAARARERAWRDVEAAQSWLSGTSLWDVREELLQYRGLDSEGYPLA